MNVLLPQPIEPEAIALLEQKIEFGRGVEFVELDELLANSDVVSIHVPLTDQTRHLVAGPEISLMKPDAILVNASRGGVVNETALCEALQQGKIAGAGLDVFSREPLPEDHPLLGLENVILRPHSAALTNECVIRMATEAAKCILDVFAGRNPPNVANPQVLESGKWKHLRPKNY